MTGGVGLKHTWKVNRMDDLISRQAAIDAIKEDKIDLTNTNVVAVFKATGDFEKVETQVMTSDRHIKILKDLPSAQPEQRWIPWTSGRFPEESGTYTVTAYDGATNRVTYAKYQKRLKRWELTGARAYWRVLTWCPPPEPYKEDDNEG